jgi:hypothetical protein
VTIFVPPRYRLTVERSVDSVSIECWIAFIRAETEISSASVYQVLPKRVLRDDQLVALGRADEKVL